ncbi:MAG TPA: hypothetical protein VGC79_16525, partial [Polyangiaceae bacterium]
MNRILACFLGLALYSLAPSASAADDTVPPAPRARETPRERNWYGWQTLTSDAASVGLLLGGVQASGGYGFYDNDTRLSANVMVTMGPAGYLAGAPTLHFIQKRPLSAIGSQGLRATLPVLGGAAGLGLAHCPPPAGQDYGNCGIGELVLGVGAGALAAIILDATLLAWAPAPAET